MTIWIESGQEQQQGQPFGAFADVQAGGDVSEVVGLVSSAFCCKYRKPGLRDLNKEEFVSYHI